MALYALTWQLHGLRTQTQEAAHEAAVVDDLQKRFECHNDPGLAHLWFISTSWDVGRLEGYLSKHFIGPDKFFVAFVEQTPTKAWYGHNLSRESLEWIVSHATDKQYLRRS